MEKYTPSLSGAADAAADGASAWAARADGGGARPRRRPPVHRQRRAARHGTATYGHSDYTLANSPSVVFFFYFSIKVRCVFV